MSRRFKNVLCDTDVTDWKYYGIAARRPCRRRRNHPGFHSNGVLEWAGPQSEAWRKGHPRTCIALMDCRCVVRGGIVTA